MSNSNNSFRTWNRNASPSGGDGTPVQTNNAFARINRDLSGNTPPVQTNNAFARMNRDLSGNAAPAQTTGILQRVTPTQSNNAFAGMSRDRTRGPMMSWADQKRIKEEEAKEAEKNRPLTDADFPTLGNTSAIVKIKAKDETKSSLATHIADTIRKDEETVQRRKREEEEAREKAALEEGIVRLPLFKSATEYVRWKKNGGSLNLPPIEVKSTQNPVFEYDF
jgi:hypothetical protein